MRPPRPIRALPLLAAAALAAAPAGASVEPPPGPLQVETIVEGLRHPWALAFLPDGRKLVTERPGALRLVEGGRLSPPLSGVPAVYASGQGGLLDVALAPDFAESGVLFLAYAEAAEGGARTAVARARLTEAGLTDVETIFRQHPALPGGRHFGARIVAAPDGTLFVGLGDRGHDALAQDLTTHVGKIVRIAPDGTVPADNPFVGRTDALPEIWSYGHRNIQGAALDAEGRLWVTEHGARGGDEINLPEPGRNYGWPVIAYGVEYSGAPIGVGTEKDGMEQPVFWWDPSIAPSGLTVYSGALWPEWAGRPVSGGLRARLVTAVDVAAGREARALTGEIGRVRDVREGPDGALWLLTDADPGGLYRVTPAD